MAYFFKIALLFSFAVSSWFAIFTPPVALGPELWSDKLQHFCVFLVLSCCCDMAFPKRRFLVWKFLPIVIYGLAIELIQSQIPGRDASSMDLMTDLLAVAVYWLARRPVRWIIYSLVPATFSQKERRDQRRDEPVDKSLQ